MKKFNSYGIKVLRKSSDYNPRDGLFYRAMDSVANALTSFFGSKVFYWKDLEQEQRSCKPVKIEDDFDYKDFENIEKEIRRGFEPAHKDDAFLEKMKGQLKEEIDEICSDMDIESLVRQIKGTEPEKKATIVEIETISSKIKKSSGSYPLVDAIKKYEKRQNSYESYEWIFEENPMFDDYLFE